MCTVHTQKRLLPSAVTSGGPFELHNSPGTQTRRVCHPHLTEEKTEVQDE